nr:hypothetical protein [Pseudarcicella sp.]
PIDQWTYFIKNAENLHVIPESVADEGLQEAYKEADQQSWSKLELEDYERASIKERDEIGRVEFAEKKAMQKGKIEGEKEKAINIAKGMKAKGFDLETIVELTGLSYEDIAKI